MAKNVNIKLGANITDFESKMKRAQRGFKKTAANLKKIGKSMSLSLTAPLTAFAAASVKAFDTQAKAEAQLRTALGENETAFKNLTEQAKELQEITLFGDEETIAAASFLAQMGLQEDAIKRLIPLIQDMATAKGMSLTAAADLVAKSVGSSTNALSRYGIQIDGAVGSTERLDSAVDALSKQFKGQAQAAAKAGTGSLKQLQNTIGDLMEDIGEMLMPIIQKLVDKIQIGVDKFKSLSDEQKENALQIGLLVAAIGPAVYILGTLATALGGLATAFLFLSGTAIPAVIGALETLYLLMLYNPITAIALGITALGASLYLLIDNLSDATDEQVKFNSALEDATVLTKDQADAIDNIVFPFVAGVTTATKKVKDLKIALKEVAQITSLDNDNSLEGGLIRVRYELDETEDSMSALGQTAMNTFSMIFDRVLQFRGTFVNVLEEIGIMLGKVLLKAVAMAAILSLLSGGAGGAGILGVGKGLSFAEAFGQTLTGRASGGNVVAGQPYLVGEKGPELFMSGQSGTIIPNNNLGGASIPDVKISGEDLIIVFDRAKRHRNALG